MQHSGVGLFLTTSLVWLPCSNQKRRSQSSYKSSLTKPRITLPISCPIHTIGEHQYIIHGYRHSNLYPTTVIHILPHLSSHMPTVYIPLSALCTHMLSILDLHSHQYTIKIQVTAVTIQLPTNIMPHCYY